ncbi:hypothetical protein ACH5RR_006691 [Cinchona calisaya]|uniref:Uncharacterized protein n=1 Tax=Cinchona calisaya TaxID=153742 RepID=A0ABD3APS9_9GENT
MMFIEIQRLSKLLVALGEVAPLFSLMAAVRPSSGFFENAFLLAGFSQALLKLRNRFKPKFYIVATSDNMSLQNWYYATGLEIEEIALREQKMQNF